MSALSVTLLVAVLICNSVAGNDRLQTSPLGCTDNGRYYPLYAKWASTRPGECAEYTCAGHDTVEAVACPTVEVDEDAGQTCYDISVPDAPYPSCCTEYHCVSKLR